jgi:trk system potassium uptake protein TrkH
MATGGFSTKSASIGHYDSLYIHIVIIIFMFLAGVNFALYYFLFKGRGRDSIRDPEFRVYIGIILVAIILVTLNLVMNKHHETATESLHQAAFQVVAISTTTGYGTDNFNLYPTFSKVLLVVLMFIGASAGSTGGGMKVFRMMIILKHAYYEIRRVIKPREVVSPKIGGQPLRPEIVQNVTAFFIIAISVFILATLFMAWLGTYEERLDIVTATTCVSATLWNIGPGLEKVGSIENYAFIPSVGKWVLAICMLMGRLEIYTIIVLFFPLFWKR